MRIVTWNCCRGRLASKLQRLNALDPTFASVQECPQPPSGDSTLLWHGKNPRQGVGLLVAEGYSLIPEPVRDAPLYTVPVHVRGAHSFFALAIWSQKASLYVEGVLRAIDIYRDLIDAHPTVLLGDFNSNVLWDDDHPRDRNHTALVQTCAQLGLVSAYHLHFGEKQGEESQPTLYLLKKRSRPYHIDYCFIPVAWAPHLVSVQIGTFDQWADASDHQPVIVDLDLPRN